MKKSRVINSFRENIICWMVLSILCCSATSVYAQYEDSPLKGRKWYTISGGVNSMELVSWQGMATFSSRGESVLTQARIGYSQELVKATDDSCSQHKNRLIEAGLLWGDGWAGKKWYFTAALGFGFNVRLFCRHTEYEDQYLTAVTLGLPLQVEFGVLVSKNIGVNLVGSANWNFRAPYAGGHLGMFYRLAKAKPVRQNQE